MRNWTETIQKLKSFVSSIEPLWTGTKLSGFSSGGPFHCSNCEYLNRERNRCKHEVMKADPEVEHDKDGLAVITDPERQCCEFVEPTKLTQIGGEYTRARASRRQKQFGA